MVDFVYPPRCPLCGTAIAAQNGLCAGCWEELAFPTGAACASCQRPVPTTLRDGEGLIFCGPCLARPPAHDGIAAAVLYNDASRRLVLKYKHGGRLALAELIARLMAPRIAALEGEWLLVPVPLHRLRLWSRGFNQSALIAQAVGRMTGHRVIPDALLRIRSTPMLGGHSRPERQRAVRGAITVSKRHRRSVQNARLVVIDDVLTSGATSGECVRVLKRSGASEVVIGCFARVL